MGMNKGLLLDRDGVINREIGRHVHRAEDLELLPGIAPFLKEAHTLGFLVIVVSNQSGISQGTYGHEDVRSIHQRIQKELQAQDAWIDDFFYSPHHPSQGNSLSRKPGSLMVERALAKHRIQPEKAILFGDKERDAEAAKKVGVRGILVEANSSLLPYISELKKLGE